MSNLKLKSPVACRKGKAVIVTTHVLIRRSRAVKVHHNHVHHTIRREMVRYGKGVDGGRFVDRRLELLHYSQRLRESARFPVPRSPVPKENLLDKHSKSQQPVRLKRQSLGAQRNHRTQTCFGNCNMTFPDFKLLKLRSGKKTSEKHGRKTGIKLNEIVTNLQKQGNFFSKVLTKLKKNK